MAFVTPAEPVRQGARQTPSESPSAAYSESPFPNDHFRGTPTFKDTTRAAAAVEGPGVSLKDYLASLTAEHGGDGTVSTGGGAAASTGNNTSTNHTDAIDSLTPRQQTSTSPPMPFERPAGLSHTPVLNTRSISPVHSLPEANATTGASVATNGASSVVAAAGRSLRTPTGPNLNPQSPLVLLTPQEPCPVINLASPAPGTRVGHFDFDDSTLRRRRNGGATGTGGGVGVTSVSRPVGVGVKPPPTTTTATTTTLTTTATASAIPSTAIANAAASIADHHTTGGGGISQSMVNPASTLRGPGSNVVISTTSNAAHTGNERNATGTNGNLAMDQESVSKLGTSRTAGTTTTTTTAAAATVAAAAQNDRNDIVIHGPGVTPSPGPRRNPTRPPPHATRLTGVTSTPPVPAPKYRRSTPDVPASSPQAQPPPQPLTVIDLASTKPAPPAPVLFPIQATTTTTTTTTAATGDSVVGTAAVKRGRSDQSNAGPSTGTAANATTTTTTTTTAGGASSNPVKRPRVKPQPATATTTTTTTAYTVIDLSSPTDDTGGAQTGFEDDRALAHRLQREADEAFARALMEEESRHLSAQALEQRRLDDLAGAEVAAQLNEELNAHVYDPHHTAAQRSFLASLERVQARHGRRGGRSRGGRGRGRAGRGRMRRSNPLDHGAMYGGPGDVMPPLPRGISPDHMQLMMRQDNFTENDYEALLRLDDNNLKKPRLSASELAALPTSVHGPEDIALDCTICLSSVDAGEQVKRLPCSHAFHRDCIDPWLHQSRQCPVCKHNL